MRLRRQLRVLQAGVVFLTIGTGALAWHVLSQPDRLSRPNAMETAVEYEALSAPLSESLGGQSDDIARLGEAVNAQADRIDRLEGELSQAQREAEQAGERADEAFDKAMEPCLIYREFC